MIFEIHACCYARQEYNRKGNSTNEVGECRNCVVVGFEDRDYYPEKNADGRVRRESVPVKTKFCSG